MTALPDTAADKPRASRPQLETVETVVVALLVALVLRVVLFQPFTIPSGSMEPGLLKGDYIVVSKFAYGWSRCSLPFCPPLFHGRLPASGPKRGDVVVFQLPRNERESLIKRVIGLPGDRVQVIDGMLLVNGALVARTRIGAGTDPGEPGVAATQFRESLPGGKSYVSLDRGPGHDGDDTDVYVVPAGRYFVMGDNRDNSLDSRWPQSIGVGFVPAENLVGKAEIILMSWRGDASLLKPWTWLDLRPDRFARLIR